MSPKQHREADRLLRAAGSRAGRGRLRPDGTRRPVRAPRGLIVVTGQDVPRGASLRARQFIVEMALDSLDWALITECQRDAAAGLYASAMAGFLRWLAPRYGEIQDNLRHEIAELRDTTADGGHRRTPEIVASLAIGLRYFLAYAVDAGAIDTAERERRWIAGWRVLLEVAQAQAAHLQAADPAQRFVELISAALGAGDAHLASLSGDVPQDNAEARGWRRETVGVDEHGHAPSGESDVCAYPATVKRDEVVLPKPLAIGVQPPPELHLGLRGDLAGPTHHCRHGGTRGLRAGARRSSAPTDRSPSHSGARVCGVVSSQVVVPKNAIRMDAI